MTDPFATLNAALSGHYRIVRELGAGGMATVYLADDIKHRRQVAVKVLRPDLVASIGAERFLREITIAANLQHPHIVPLHDSGQFDDVLFYVMPFVEGSTLRQHLQTAGALPLPDAVRILRDIADAMTAAHARGVVHRDIKPENVMISGRHALVADFGVAKAVSQATGHHTMTTAGMALGTPMYMAPEQAMADPNTDHRADIYAFGVLAFEVLTGRPPFTGTTPQAIIAAHLTTAAPPVTAHRADVPPALAGIVARCLEKFPDERYQTADEILGALDSALTPRGGIIAPNTPARAKRGPRALVVGAFAVVAIAALSLYQWLPRASRSTPQASSAAASGASANEPKSIAVLPLVNVGGDSTQEYFADGTVEELTTALGKVPGLRVAARTSAFTFKGRRDLDVRDVGEKLNVGVVLLGTVRRNGDQMKVSVQLMDAKQRTELWAETYNESVKNIFAMQDSITRAIVSKLSLTLGAGALAATVAGRTNNLKAHDLYLQAQTYLHQGTEPALRQALRYYRLALDQDPNYADATLGVSYAYSYLADAYMLPLVAYDSAKVFARRALALDSLSGDAHGLLGYASFARDWDVTTADREFASAARRSANSADVHLLMSNLQCILGRIDTGLEEADLAMKVDPLAALNSFVREWCLYLGARYDDVRVQHRKTSALDPSFIYLDWFPGAALREQHRYDESLASYAKAQSLMGEQPLHGYAITYARMGRTKEAREILTRLEAYAQRHYVNPMFFAMIHASLGDMDRAFAALNRAADDRTVLIGGLNVWPELAPLRGDPRFGALLKRVGLPARP